MNFLPEDPLKGQAVSVPQAGHAQFWHAAPNWQRWYDLICGTGSESDATIRSWATRLLSSWLLRNFAPEIGEVRGLLAPRDGLSHGSSSACHLHMVSPNP